jgi:5S rRNA maturation endonuclease (ribonuclease M5)
LLSSREKTFSRFLYYRCFYGNIKPTILCEGKTDNIYLKSVISILVNGYPTLARAKTKDNAYKLLIRFFKHSKRTRFFLGLYGGTPYLSYFTSQFEKHYKLYTFPEKPQHPVIIVLDNDSGFSKIENQLKKIDSATAYPNTLKNDDYKNADFIHVIHNLYIALTPLSPTGEDTDIEYFFDDATRLIQHNKKCFNTAAKRNDGTDLSKDAFATHIIKAQCFASITLSGLTTIMMAG